MQPYIICHMTTSLDGKVAGKFLLQAECEKATETYYEINRNYIKTTADGFICGRTTMEESFTCGYYPDLSKYKFEKIAPVPMNYWLCDEYMSGFYAVAFDPKGKLGWKSNRIVDEDPGYGGAQIIEVLTEQVDKRYLAYLQEMEIPYLFAGEKEIDVELALHTLAVHGINTLLLEGGSIINGYFQRADMIDELSLVVAPVVSDVEDKPLFTDSSVSEFELQKVQQYDGGVVWLNYKRKKKEGNKNE